jgi:molecular chaperone GrpE
MRPTMNPYGRRPDPRTVPLDTALALQEQAKSALQELERVRGAVDRLDVDNARLRETLGTTQNALARTEEALAATAAATPPPVDDALDKAVLSLKADLANVRRHQEAQVKQARQEGLQSMVSALADTFDDLSRAIDVATEPVRTGLLAVRSRVEARLAAAGVELVGAVGDAFDPALHEATGVGAGPVGTLVAILQSGLRDSDGRVVRAAKALVGQGGAE